MGRYDFDKDEFDAQDVSVPEGVHRAKPSFFKRLIPYLVALFLGMALAIMVFFLLFNPITNSNSSKTATSQKPITTTTTTTTTKTTTKKITINKKIEVVVQNGSGVAGAAADKAKILQENGYTNVTATNFEGVNAVLSVKYNDLSKKITAENIAKILGISLVQQSSDAGSQIIVILG